MENKQGLQGARRLFRVQLLLVFVVSCSVFLFQGMSPAISLLLGGLTSAIPNLVFAHILFKVHGAQAAHQIASRFYKGEAVKLLLTFGLFTLILTRYREFPLCLFAGFMVAQLMFWFAPLIIDHQQK